MRSLSIKKMVFAAMFVALGVILPILLHGVPQAGMVLLPMHIPVLLCGLICGPVFGLLCGILTPAASSLFTGMPPAAILPSMICELAVYGLIAGLLIRFIQTKSQFVNILLALVGAMLIGRVIYGAVNALIFQFGTYTLQAWLTASFVTALPGILIQIVLIPAIVFALQRSKLVETA